MTNERPRINRGSKVMMALVGGPVLLVMGLLPFLFTTLPDPTPITIPGFDGERSGMYIQQPGTPIYKLYAYSEEVADFPAGADVATTGAHVVIKYRQLDSLEAYRLKSWPDGAEIAVSKEDQKDAKLLRLTPEQPLKAGRYFVSAARDSIYGGEDYFYFEVK